MMRPDWIEVVESVVVVFVGLIVAVAVAEMLVEVFELLDTVAVAEQPKQPEVELLAESVVLG